MKPATDRDDWRGIVGLLAAFFLGLFVVELAAITLLDWMDGRPSSAVAAIGAFLDTIDGRL